MKKTEILVISESEILKKAKALGEGRSWLITATETPVMGGCDICASVLHDKIISWSIYYRGEFVFRFNSCKEAIAYLRSSEE